MIVGSCSGTVYALDRATGEPVWLYSTEADGASAQFHGEPLLTGGDIIIPADAGSSAHVYRFDVASGDVRWKTPFAGGVATTPLLRDGRLVVLSAAGTLASLDARSGEVVWKITPAGALEPIPRIQSPAEADGRIFFADNNRTLFAIDAKNGRQIWKKDLGARLNTSLVVAGDEVIGGTADGLLHHLDVRSGDTKRVTKLNGLPYGTLISARDALLILVKSDAARLVAYAPGDGAVLWEQTTPDEWTTYRPLVAGDLVIAGNEARELCAFHLTDGEQRWCTAISGVPRGLGIAADEALYVGTLGGKVFAFSRDRYQ